MIYHGGRSLVRKIGKRGFPRVTECPVVFFLIEAVVFECQVQGLQRKGSICVVESGPG
jgi:hypothetical protein